MPSPSMSPPPMRVPSAFELMELWDRPTPTRPHARLSPLVEAMFGEAARRDTLGRRNRRLLDIHARLFGGEMEAVANCPGCGAAIETSVPAEAIRALPVPAPDAEAEIAHQGRRLRFRLPVMDDLDAAAGGTSPRQALALIVARCRLGADEATPPKSETDSALLAALTEAFERLDPAANIVLDTQCPDCGQGRQASLDLAGFVVRDVERAVTALARDVDRLARAYGWSESEILALPPARRRRYLALAAPAGTTGLPQSHVHARAPSLPRASAPGAAR